MSSMFNNNQENISTDGTPAAPASAYGYPTYPPVVGQMDWSQAQAMMAASMAWPGMNFNNQYAGSYPDMSHVPSMEPKTPLSSSSTENSPMTSAFNNSTESGFNCSTGSSNFSPAVCKTDPYNAFTLPVSGYLPHTVTPSGTIMQGKKKKPVPVPEYQKDENYRRRRMRNNESARKSREERKKAEEAIKYKKDYLQMENETLRMQLQNCQAELVNLRAQLAMQKQ